LTVTVLFIWDVREELRDYIEKGLKDIRDLNLIFPSPAEEDEYQKHIQSANIVIGWRPSEELLNQASSLDLFINPGAGVQHHIERFRELNKDRKIVLVNGHGNAYFTGQHAVALLLALTNKIIPHHNWMNEGLWRRGDSFAKSTPVRWRDVGFLGYGAVNKNAHRFLSGFDVSFHILKRSWTENEDTPTPAKKYTPDQLAEFLKVVNTLIVAVPQTDETEGLIGAEELGYLGEEGLLVNMARGSVIDEQSLYDALKTKKIAGAAIDVWYEYRPEEDDNGKKYPYNFPFHELENVILSPHRGASPMDDLHRWNEVVENITRYTNGRNDFLNQVELERGY
jgi:phosphoglycerate dehydrogenase-like enzyme